VEKWKILLVDDEEDFMSTLAERLRLRGLVVLTAVSVEEAFTAIKHSPPHLVVFDIQLGPDVVRQLRFEHPDIPVIILTDIGQHLPGAEGLRLGARRCLMKPFQIEELLDAIKESLGITSLETV
jgi:DNA-binding response OmpR family regulator